MKIALLFGGRGAERAVSLLSATAVYPRLVDLGHHVFAVGIDPSGALFHPSGAPAPCGKTLSLILCGDALLFEGEGESFTPDLVFSLVHGTDGEDGAWQGALTLCRTPFIGAPVTASAIAIHKRITKELAASRGIPVVPYLSAKSADATVLARVACTLSYPLFVKPATGGSSVGVSRVETEEGLLPALEHALLHSDEALIEEAVDGSEIEVAILERNGVLLLSPPGEIRTKDHFYDYNTKYLEKTAEYFLPATLSLWETAYVKQLAASVFRLIGCRDLARVDFLRRKDGKIYLNEINTLPGFTEDSLFPRLFSLIGIDPLLFLTEGRS